MTKVSEEKEAILKHFLTIWQNDFDFDFCFFCLLVCLEDTF